MALTTYSILRNLNTKQDIERYVSLISPISEEVKEVYREAWRIAPSADLLEKTPAPASVVEDVKDGTYTIAHASGHITVKLETVTKGNLTGKRICSLLNGPDNETSFKGFGFVDGAEVRMWANQKGNEKYETARHAVMGLFHAEDLQSFQEAYAMASGRCARCNRKLTVPASIHRGLGPECAKVVGA